MSYPARAEGLVNRTTVSIISLFFNLSLESEWQSSQVFRTLLSILANHKYTTVWIVSIIILIFYSSILSSKLFGAVPSVPIKIVSPSPWFSIDFLVLWQGPSICQFFHCHWFFLCDPWERQNPQDGKFLLSLLINTRSSLLAACITKSQTLLCFSIPKNRFWFMLIIFGSMIKILSLA